VVKTDYFIKISNWGGKYAIYYFTMISNFALTMLAGCVAAQQVIVTDSTASINKFGNMVVETIFEDLIHKVITKPIVPFAQDYAQQTKHIENLTKLASRLNNHF